MGKQFVDFKYRVIIISLVWLSYISVLGAEGDEIELLPQRVTLSGQQASQRVSIQKKFQGDFTGPVTSKLTWQSSDLKVVKVVDNRLIPTGNGQARVTVKADGSSSSCQVTVVGMHQKNVRSFRNHVQPVFTKSACNSGACHGALAGKGGFKLSLRAYDTLGDYRSITQEMRGRRVELAEPARSLLLTKPTAAISHKGGIRFDIDSEEYRIISEWIAQGANPPDTSDALITRLEVLPEHSTLKRGSRQELIVLAHYSDSSIVDVTRWTQFTSSDLTVATVDDSGAIDVTGSGSGAVVCQFASKIAISNITAPYEHQVDPQVYAQSPQHNFIDELVLKQLKKLNIKPSPACTDAEFVRRAYLDTIGTLPTITETKTFLQSSHPDKRKDLIEELLSRPEFVDYWSYKWSDLLLVNGKLIRPEAVKAYYKWIQEHVKKDTPWDRMVYELITAQGGSLKNGATNFYAIHQDPESMMENVSQAFLGLSIGCAKCHNHPLEKWTNDQYYAMANMFARVRAKGWGGSKGAGDGKRTLFVALEGDLVQPVTGKPQPPTPLDGQPIDSQSIEDRRIPLANWLTSRNNKMFSRSITNRIWANFFGVGLVEQIDDMRASNPASNEALLTATAEYLVEHKFQLKDLMRAILQSATYQRSSLALPENRQEKRFYSRYYPRRMMSEVLLDAISQVMDVPDDFSKMERSQKKTDFYPKGTRAIQLYDSDISSYFLSTFGRNERMITCECERTAKPSLVQVLHISNGKTINEKLKSSTGRIEQLLKSNSTNDEIISQAYLMSLSRLPSKKERAELLQLLSNASPEDRRIVVEDLFWGIMSSREFLFNH